MPGKDQTQIKLTDILSKRRKIIEGHVMGEHAMEMLMFARQNNTVIAIRDLSPYADRRLAESLFDNFENERKRSYKSTGKDITVKSKSAVDQEIAGYIPIKNLLSKKPARTELEREEIDGKLKQTLDQQDAKYKSIPVVISSNGTEYELYYYLDNNEKGYSYCYKNLKDNRFIANLGGADEIDLQTKSPEKVEVLGDLDGNPIIPDYDLAFIGHKRHSDDFFQHTKFGNVRSDEISIISDLENLTDKMVRHGPDTQNPFGFEFEMSNITPYTIFTPQGEVFSADSPEKYIDQVNELRSRGYDINLNPRTGVIVNSEGEFELPSEELRENFSKINKENKEITNEEQRNDAIEIYENLIELRNAKGVNQKSLIDPKLSTQENLDNLKKQKQKIKHLNEILEIRQSSYLEKYEEKSPTQKELDRVYFNQSQREIDRREIDRDVDLSSPTTIDIEDGVDVERDYSTDFSDTDSQISTHEGPRFNFSDRRPDYVDKDIDIGSALKVVFSRVKTFKNNVTNSQNVPRASQVLRRSSKKTSRKSDKGLSI